MRNKYMKPRGTRTEYRNDSARFRGGKLVPVHGMILRESESAVLSQTITYELDKVAGRLITEVNADVICVAVPAQAMDALKNPLDDYPGNAEVFRQKLLSGNPVFDLEPEGEISQRCGINPRSIAGVKNVNECFRLAHNAAVNFLRTRKYVKATKLDANNTAITPALIAKTVLDRLNAVLDPEDRVNGAIQFGGDVQFSGSLDIEGLFLKNTTNASAALDNLDNSGTSSSASSDVVVKRASASSDPAPAVAIDFANFLGSLASDAISTQDFFQTEKMDRLTREMRQLVDQYPQYGEELINRFAHGLTVDTGNQPFVLYEKSDVFGRQVRSAMDGPSLDVQQTDLMAQHSFTVPVPPSEFGYVIITFASVRPDEALASQPHPLGSDVWAARNYVADELALDPVPVTIRDLYADCDEADEATISCYVGNNHLLKTYVNYGFQRQVDIEDVAEKTAIWQLEVPMSVTPDSVIYPDDISHYPFGDAVADVCTFSIESLAQIATPVIFGPTPVEELAEIETSDIFEDGGL